MLLLLRAGVPPKRQGCRTGNAQPRQPCVPTASLVGRGGPGDLRAWSTLAARVPPWAPCTSSILPSTGGTGSGGTLARAVPGHGARQVRLPCQGGGTAAGSPVPRAPEPVPDLAPGPSKRVSFANKLRPAASACQVRTRLAGPSRGDRDAWGWGSGPGTKGPWCCSPCPGPNCPVALGWARTQRPLLASWAGSRQGRAEAGQRLARAIRLRAGGPGSLAGQDGALPSCWGAATVPVSVPCRMPLCHQSR